MNGTVYAQSRPYNVIRGVFCGETDITLVGVKIAAIRTVKEKVVRQSEYLRMCCVSFRVIVGANKQSPWKKTVWQAFA